MCVHYYQSKFQSPFTPFLIYLHPSEYAPRRPTPIQNYSCENAPSFISLFSPITAVSRLWVEQTVVRSLLFPNLVTASPLQDLNGQWSPVGDTTCTKGKMSAHKQPSSSLMHECVHFQVGLFQLLSSPWEVGQRVQPALGDSLLPRFGRGREELLHCRG